jgi:membrane-associated phospholipid phosphatase
VRELLYIPVPADIKYKAKIFIDMFINKFATGFGAGLFLVLRSVRKFDYRVDQPLVLIREMGVPVIVFLLLFFCLSHVCVAMKDAAGCLRPYEAMSGLWVVEAGDCWTRLDRPLEARRCDSFPSGHAATAMAVCLLLIAFDRRYLTSGPGRYVRAAILVLAPIAIGASRIYLGVHHLTDVLAGWFLGAAWFSLCWWWVRGGEK